MTRKLKVTQLGTEKLTVYAKQLAQALNTWAAIQDQAANQIAAWTRDGDEWDDVDLFRQGAIEKAYDKHVACSDLIGRVAAVLRTAARTGDIARQIGQLNSQWNTFPTVRSTIDVFRGTYYDNRYLDALIALDSKDIAARNKAAELGLLLLRFAGSQGAEGFADSRGASAFLRPLLADWNRMMQLYNKIVLYMKEPGAEIMFDVNHIEGLIKDADKTLRRGKKDQAIGMLRMVSGTVARAAQTIDGPKGLYVPAAFRVQAVRRLKTFAVRVSRYASEIGKSVQ